MKRLAVTLKLKIDVSGLAVDTAAYSSVLLRHRHRIIAEGLVVLDIFIQLVA